MQQQLGGRVQAGHELYWLPVAYAVALVARKHYCILAGAAYHNEVRVDRLAYRCRGARRLNPGQHRTTSPARCKPSSKQTQRGGGGGGERFSFFVDLVSRL